MVAAGDAPGPDPPSSGNGRLYAVASLLLLMFFAAADVVSRSGSTGWTAVEAWPLGSTSQGGPFLAWTSLALAISLGWGIPGLALAVLSDGRLRGAALLGRALILGVGYVLVTGLGHAVLTGHAPGRLVLSGLLAVPPGLLLARAARNNSSRRDGVIVG